MQIQIEKNLLFLVLTGRLKFRVEHFTIFEKLIFATISRILRILMEHIETKNSLDSKLQTFYIFLIFDTFCIGLCFHDWIFYSQYISPY